MSQNYYNIYINSVLDLAQTLVIKSEESASSINEYLKMIYGDSIVDPNDLTSWKYYQNICGQYHITDNIITITSLDTLEKITFSTDNLKLHKSTSKAYQFGTRHYIELLALHPDKEQIILGILYPANMDYAISSPDGTILSYPKYLIESNEISLIEKLNNIIEVYKIRWHNSQFGVTDSLYSAAHLGLLYLHLVPSILNIRLAACKTNEAHSFHIRQYLASHGMLDIYLNTLTLKQTLFFYRNIAYIERNSGKKEVFSWLVENILTERNLPLSEFTMKHSEVDMIENLYPTVMFRKKAINNVNTYQNKTSFTLEEVLEKERFESLGNKDFIDSNITSTRSVFNNSLSSVLATKLLESSVVDYTDSALYSMQSILLNEWIDLSSKNIYNVYISFVNPRSGTRLTLMAKNAYIYMMYIFAKSLGSNIERVPSFISLRAQRIPPPDENELMSIVDSAYIDSALAREIISYQPDIPPDKPILSVESFYNTSVDIYNATQAQIKIISRQQHLYRKSLVYNMVSRMYTDNVIHFEDEGQLFSDWLINHELPDYDFSDSEYQELYKNIYEAATGSVLNSTNNIRNLQSSMLNLLKQLSSYTIQIISEINNSNIKLLNWSTVRLGDRKYNQNGLSFTSNVVSVLNTNNIISNKTSVTQLQANLLNVINKNNSNKFNVNLIVSTSINKMYSFYENIKIPISNIGILIKELNENIVLENNTHLFGYDSFTLLNTNDKKSIRDIYNNW